MDRTRLNLQQSLGGKQQEALNVIADLNKDIIGLSAEDSIAQELLQKQRDEKIASTISELGLSEELIKNIQEQSDIADKTAQITEKQQKFLNKQL